VEIQSVAPFLHYLGQVRVTEHECHHRGQIYLYLGMLGVPTPPLYGLTSEQVRAESKYAFMAVTERPR
jgi:uncharacterized damage-inducible protein DinB